MPIGAAWDAFELRGYSPWSAEKIAREALEGRRRAPSEMPGDFVVTARGVRAGRPVEAIITSAVAAMPYFHARAGGAFVHGPSVFDVARRAGLAWRWNERAVRCLAWLGHTFGEDTLHPDVRRVPPDAVLLHDGERLELTHGSFWRGAFGAPRASLDEAVRAFGEATDDLLAERPVVTLSAGFDSRAVLARVLRAGVRPALLTMGRADATDRIVAAAIARDHGLDHHVVELHARDYLTHGKAIAAITSGTKTAGNWHTYLFSRHAAGLAPGPLLGGTNGEFARTYYRDKGAPARAFDLGPTRLATAYFAARIERRRRRFPFPLPFLRDAGPAAALALARDLGALVASAPSPLDALDLFYATQRVRHFIGNGLALCAATKPPASPFLDARWIRAAGHLRRADKLGSRLHRRIIADNAPGLLRYPVHAEPEMAREPPPLYWRRRSPEVSYNVFGEVIRLPAVRDLVVESRALDDLGPRAERERVFDHAHAESIELLLTLHFAAEAAQDAGSATAPSVVRA